MKKKALKSPLKERGKETQEMSEPMNIFILKMRECVMTWRWMDGRRV